MDLRQASGLARLTIQAKLGADRAGPGGVGAGCASVKRLVRTDVLAANVRQCQTY